MTDSPDQKAPSLTHIGTLDGIRGIAVLLVICFHFSWSFMANSPGSHTVKRLFPVGWVGVDLFFVLSGYLITRGLVAPSSRPKGERLKLFWIRRFLRIFPLYYAVILVGTVVALATHGRPPELSYWLYVQNYALAFDPDPERWTSHLWSLAIEEQFYFVWPLVALLVSRKRLLPLIVALFLFGVVGRAGLVFATHHWDVLTTAKLAYRATPTRMDGLLLGAAIATMGHEPEAWLSRAWLKVRRPLLFVSALVFLALVLVTRGFLNEDRRVIVLGYPVIATLFACVVSLGVDGQLPKRVTRFFESKPLVACGRVSYGMYMFHWPLVALGIPFFKHAETYAFGPSALALGFACTLGGILVTYVAAEVSFRAFETPFLNLKSRFHG